MPRSWRHFLVLWSPASSRLPAGALAPVCPPQAMSALSGFAPAMCHGFPAETELLGGRSFFFFNLISHGNPCFYTELIVHIVKFSHSAVSSFLQPYGLQHTRLRCSSPTLRTCSDSCSLSHWCHPTISSSVSPFCSCLQSFPASGSLPVSQFFASSGQSIGVSASTSVLPVNIQDWFPLELNGFISLQSKGVSRVFSDTPVQNISSLVLSFLYGPTLTSIHDY